MYQNDAQKVLTGEVRLSYCNLIQPRAPLSGQGDPQVFRHHSHSQDRRCYQSGHRRFH